MGDLRLDAEKIDVARLREREETAALRGCRRWAIVLRHDATDTVVARTKIEMVSSVDDYARQQITSVDSGRRGHRLGTIAKIESLRYLLAEEHDVTWNAEVNKHLIAINEVMGLEAVDRWVFWSGDI
ncbi:hypothetical protein ACGFIY_33005 [Micromonospora chersina]|uniref:hypothetical protein n=1 Tax=Micromonospora chersina TaxID=47854 RepID=UPI003714D907